MNHIYNHLYSYDKQGLVVFFLNRLWWKGNFDLLTYVWISTNYEHLEFKNKISERYHKRFNYVLTFIICINNTANLWTRFVSTPLSDSNNPVILSVSSLRPNALQFTHFPLLLKKWLIHYLLRSSKWKKKC